MVQLRSCVVGVLAAGIATCGCGEVFETEELNEELKAASGRERPGGGSAIVVTQTSGFTSESGG